MRTPAEWEPHERTIMGWPCRAELWGEFLAQAQADYAAVANAVAAFEPVTMIANPGAQAAAARSACAGEVEIVELPIDDSWLRDNGPIYREEDDGSRTAVHFRFNAWGEKFSPWDRDARVGALVARRLGDPVVEADLVLEGGSILTDGQGTLLTTEQCLLHPSRNPTLDREEIEQALRTQLGVSHIVWLGQGLVEDRDTDGHVDLIAAFTHHGKVLLQTVPEGNPNAENCAENVRRLRDAGLAVAELPFLPYGELGGETIAASYLNLYLCNGGVIVPVTGAETDAAALALIAAAFPVHQVVTVPGLTIAYGGGGPHCITQQVPPAPMTPELIVNTAIPVSPARTRAAERPPLRVGLVQEAWHPDPAAHRDALATGIRTAVGEGARIVCLQELTLSPYFAVTPDGPGAAGIEPEDLADGPTVAFAAEMAVQTGAYVHASLFERAEPETGDRDGRGYNTAVVLGPDGRLVQRTRKLHIPITAGYYEDRYFRPGPAADGEGVTGPRRESPFPVIPLPLTDDPAGDYAQLGAPTCWDQWFPELARAYSLRGAEVLVYPTAIGSEPDHPDFDTQPLWEKVIVGNGVANGTFMVAVNRIGHEPPLTFYGSSFISDPYGRILVRAPRDAPAVLVADLDLDQRRDWLELFPFLSTRRPDAYGLLTG